MNTEDSPMALTVYCTLASEDVIGVTDCDRCRELKLVARIEHGGVLPEEAPEHHGAPLVSEAPQQLLIRLHNWSLILQDLRPSRSQPGHCWCQAAHLRDPRCPGAFLALDRSQ